MKVLGVNSIQNDIERVQRKIIDLHYKSGMSHLGGSLSCLASIVVLYSQIMRSEDLFILSNGHSASALYSSLWSIGKLKEDIDSYCTDGTRLGTHPPANLSEETPFGTGSLGHGLSLAAGLALGKKLKKQGGRVFCLCSDGEIQEGSVWEAIIFSVHHKLGNLRLMVDVNGLQGFGSTAEVASMDLAALKDRIQAFGMRVSVCDGHDVEDLRNSLSAEMDSEPPNALLMKTCKGKGVPSIEGLFVSHYSKLTRAQYDEAITYLEKGE
jgi:transketolase